MATELPLEILFNVGFQVIVPLSYAIITNYQDPSFKIVDAVHEIGSILCLRNIRLVNKVLSHHASKIIFRNLNYNGSYREEFALSVADLQNITLLYPVKCLSISMANMLPSCIRQSYPDEFLRIADNVGGIGIHAFNHYVTMVSLLRNIGPHLHDLQIDSRYEHPSWMQAQDRDDILIRAEEIHSAPFLNSSLSLLSSNTLPVLTSLKISNRSLYELLFFWKPESYLKTILPLGRYRLPNHWNQGHGFQTLLSNLLHFSMTVDLVQDDWRSDQELFPMFRINMLEKMTSLQKLDLDISCENLPFPLFDSTSPSITLYQNLTVIALSNLIVNGEQLIAALSTASHLFHIKLHHILIADDYEWKTIFTFCKKNLHLLQSLHFLVLCYSQDLHGDDFFFRAAQMSNDETDVVQIFLEKNIDDEEELKSLARKVRARRQVLNLPPNPWINRVLSREAQFTKTTTGSVTDSDSETEDS